MQSQGLSEREGALQNGADRRQTIHLLGSAFSLMDNALSV